MGIYREDWDTLYRDTSQLLEQENGYYNKNYICSIGNRFVILRVPIENCDEMDLRLIPESETLRYLHEKGFPVPHVLHASESHRYQVHQYIPGTIINDAYPRGVALPDQFIKDVVMLIEHLYTLEDFIGWDYLKDWPESGDTGGFFTVILNNAKTIYDTYKNQYGDLYGAFGIPRKPFYLFENLHQTMTSRPFRLCHCDIHRKNCILSDGRIWFIDWELALIADPAYDLAVHLHKMTYLPDEEATFYNLLREAVPSAILKGIDDDIEKYIKLEQMKSLVVDTVRYHKQIHDKTVHEETRRELAAKFARKLQKAEAFFGNNVFTEKQVLDIFANTRSH